MHRDDVLGVLVADNKYARKPISHDGQAQLRLVAQQIARGVGGVLLARQLQEQLDQQIATSDILRVISQSQEEVQPVFDAIAASALRLCNATSVWVAIVRDGVLHGAAVNSFGSAGERTLREVFPRPVDLTSVTGRAVLSGTVCYMRDIREDSTYGLHSLAQAAGYQSIAAIPMLHAGKPLGAITIIGSRPAMFTDRQIAMLQTFADQAVSAIENTRLFTELQDRLEE